MPTFAARYFTFSNDATRCTFHYLIIRSRSNSPRRSAHECHVVLITHAHAHQFGMPPLSSQMETCLPLLSQTLADQILSTWDPQDRKGEWLKSMAMAG